MKGGLNEGWGFVRFFCYLALGLYLTACASNPQRPPVVKVVPVPSELTEQVPEPQLQGDNNAALVDWIERLKAALREANRRLRGIESIKP